MDQPGRRNINIYSSDSRISRLITAQELLLEYSLVIIVLACFFLVSLSFKLFSGELIVHEDGICLKRMYSEVL